MPRHLDRRRLGAWLKSERQQAGLTQEALADALRLSQGSLSNLEIGQRRIDVLEFIDLAAVLDTTPQVLLGRLLTYLRRGTD